MKWYLQGFHDEELVPEPEAQSPSQTFPTPVTMNKPWIFQRLSDLVGSSNPYYGSSLFDHKVKLVSERPIAENGPKSPKILAQIFGLNTIGIITLLCTFCISAENGIFGLKR